MILIDNNQIIIANLFSLLKSSDTLDENLLRHMILNTYRMYRKKFNNKYGELVICNDSRSWRKDVFEFYKANRKTQKSKSDIDWDSIHHFMDVIRKEVGEVFPYKMLHVQNAEADDIIAVICREYWQAEDILIVSSDKDFQQLQIYPSVSQYSPIKKEMLVCENPKNFLMEHIVRGDTSDGIPNVLSDDDVFVCDDKRQSRITKKVLKEASDKILAGEVENWNHWHRNEILIDFKYIPENIIENILKNYNEDYGGHRNKILSYLIENKMKGLIDSIEDF